MAKKSKSKGSRYAPGTRFAFRTPLLPFSAFREWGQGCTGAGDADLAALRERMRKVVEDPAVREAVFVASPDLDESFQQWLEEPDSVRGQKVERSLARYLSRMACRPTPFGLFSGVSVGRIDPDAVETKLEVPALASYGRSTRVDNDYLFALAEDLLKDPAIRGALTYRPNSSLYTAAGRLRYAEARLRGKMRTYHLVAVEPTPYLLATLERSKGGAKLPALAEALVADDPEIELEEAVEFIDELVASQILVTRLGVAVTGPEPIEAFLAELRTAAPDHPATQALTAAAAAIRDIDAARLGNEPGRYRAIAESLQALPTPVELSRLFQVDMVKPAPDAVLGSRVLSVVELGIETLRKMTPPPGDGTLGDFKRAFNERYEDREVPLVEALDEESGIGFEASRAPGAEGSPLLANLDFPGRPGGAPTTQWSGREAWLLNKLLAGGRELRLTDDDVKMLSVTQPTEMPDAFSAMVEVAAASPEAMQNGRFQVLLEGASGPSGARLMGRFCHAGDDIRAMVAEHITAEEALRPDAVFAEVVHLNEGRIGNIQCRPVLRGYEIPFLGISGAPEDHQIPVTDLMVSVRGDRIVLRSRKLDKEVIPRLSTAHNYRLRSLGMYRFLCALQSQDRSGAYWRWGAVDAAAFLPRVTYKQLVFARAQWNISRKDLEPIEEAAKGSKSAKTPDQIRELRARVFDAVAALRQKRDLPRYVVLSDGDNELPIDFDNAISVDSFAQLVKRRGGCTLRELFPGPDELVARGPEGAFTTELVLQMTRAAEPVELPPAKPRPPVRRTFAPGSEWLYAKLYTGQSTGDRVLREIVAPTRAEAMQSGAADHWFFIRYADPQDHIRVRFHGDPQRLLSEVLPALQRHAQPLLDEGSVWKVVVDTYEREADRYGGPAGIEPAERLFWADSEAVLSIVELLDGDEGADARWRLALRGADMLMEDCGLDFAARDAAIQRSRDNFGREFNATTDFQKQLGSRFRDERDALFALVARDPATDNGHDLEPGFELLAQRSERIRPIAAELRALPLTAPVEEIAWSYVHMHVNRLCHASQRAHEFVIYDFLKRVYASLRSRQPGPGPG